MDQKKVDEYFKTHDLDVVYMDYDGNIFPEKPNHPKWTVHYRQGEKEVRVQAAGNAVLESLVWLVQTLKMHKMMGKEIPSYEEYLKLTEDYGYKALELNSYEFASINVFKKLGSPISAAQNVQYILLQDQTVVPALFIKAYGGGK